MKVMLELDLPEGKSIADIKSAVSKAFDPDWMSIWWHVDDVLMQAEERFDEKLTIEEAREVLCDMERKHDPVLGVTWITLDHWIAEVLTNRKD